MEIAGLTTPLFYEPLRHVYRFFTNQAYRNYTLLYSRLAKRPRFTPCRARVHGSELSIPDAASFLSAYHEIFVEDIYAFPFDGEAPRILDLGANIGLSVLYFKRLYPKASITALEADPAIYAHLEKNVRGNGYADVKLVNKAVWYETTTLRFRAEGADGGRAALPGDLHLIDVAAVDVRDILRGERFDFLKMDIEGAEETVLPACREFLPEIGRVFVEYHSKAGQPQGLAAILGTLADTGFRVHVHSVHPSPSPFMKVRESAGFDMQLNIFAWRDRC